MNLWETKSFFSNVNKNRNCNGGIYEKKTNIIINNINDDIFAMFLYGGR